MRINIRPSVWPVIMCLCFAAVPPGKVFAKDKKLTPEALVAEHLKSIGNPETLAGIKSRAFTGNASIEFILGNVGLLVGQYEFVSEKQKQGIFYKYPALDYPGEHFAFDGKNVTVSYISPGRRSPLGDFLNRNDGIIKQGLMGGVLSVNWPLLNTDQNRAGMKYRKRKVDGRELHELEYSPPKDMGEIKVKLYFDLETFRHVKTEYKVHFTQRGAIEPILDDVLTDSLDTETYYVLTEEYSDFLEIDGLTLPQCYTIHYSREGRGGTFMARWTMEALRWSHNTPINPQFYTVQ